MNTRALREAVQSAVNGVDPEGLLRMGAPVDEYDPEIADFVGAIAQDLPVTEGFVRRTWERWFAPLRGDQRAFSELAGRLVCIQRRWRER